MLKTLATVLAISIPSFAHAEGLVITGGCLNGGVCIVAPLQNPNVITLPRMTAEQEERDAKWVAFCKPVPVRDSLGVSRYTYAHEGCEFGRTE